MAVINVDDIYILDNTGQQVDDAVDYGLFNSNDNLLDNWYFVGGGSQLGDGIFPINQRGQTQYTAAGFVFDRWFKSGGVTATLDAGGLTIANSNGWPDGVNQRFPMHFFAQMNGEAITASVLYEDGTIDSGTAVIDATQNYQWLKYPEAGEIGFQLKNFQDGAPYDYFDYISFGAGANSTPKKIKAFKLEKGIYSTIANDAMPKLSIARIPCYENHLRLKGQYAPVGYAIALSTTLALLAIPTPVPMRIAPTPSLSGTLYFNAGTPFAITSVQNPTLGVNQVMIQVVGAFDTGKVYLAQFRDANSYLDLSAEL